MPRALWTGASGMEAQQTNVDVIANNIANVNTVGFKRQRANFQDLFYDISVQPGAKASDLGRNPTGTQIGTGVKLSGTPRIFTAGNIEITGTPTDLAIDGDGFFKVTLPDGSTDAYTRAGDFKIDANGNLVTPDGYLVPGVSGIDSALGPVSIGTTGEVTQGSATRGQLNLVRFANASGLAAIGRNLFTESVASGTPEERLPGSAGVGTIRSGALEKANVEVVTELVNLIVAQRAYESNSKSIKTSDEMLRTANEIVR
jgi:flagellar basal-body rod protein FlgG